MRYTIRTLLLIVTLCGVGFAILAKQYFLHRQFDAAVNELRTHRIEVFGEYGSPIDVHISAKECIWDDTVEESLYMLGKIDSLDLSRLTLTEEQSRILYSLPGLRTITISGGVISGMDVRNIQSNARSVVEIEVYGCSLGSDELNRLTQLPRLQRLHYQDGLESPAISPVLDIRSSATLLKLELDVDASVTIHSMPKIETICVSCALRTEGVVNAVIIETCPELKLLRIAFSDISNSNNGLLQGIADQPSLTNLTLMGARLAADDINRFGAMRSLRSIILLEPWMESDSVAALNKFTNVELLHIRHPRMPENLVEDSVNFQERQTTSIWAVLQECHNVRDLTLAGEFDSQESIAWVTSMKQLRRLNLAHSVASWKDSLNLALSDLLQLGSFDYLEELVVDDVDLPEFKIRKILPKTKVINGDSDVGVNTVPWCVN